MSGALTPLGTTSFSGSPLGFAGLLQHAAFRYVPFKVLAAGTTVGRKMAIHDFPFADGVQTEDMGAQGRRYRFTGYLIGPAGPVLEKLLIRAAEQPGPGLLIHPSIGARQVVCLSLSTAVRVDRQRVVEVHFDFLEHTEGSGFLSILATVAAVFATVASGLSTSKTSFSAKAVPAAAVGSDVTAEGVRVSTAFTAQAVQAMRDSPGTLRSVAGLPGNYGRYAYGSLRYRQPADTVAEAQANATTARAAVTIAAAVCNTTIAALGASSDYVGDLNTLVESTRAALIDPADQVRVLRSLASFSYTDSAGGTAPIGAAMATMRDAVASAARRAAVLALARAAAEYRPTSHTDAVRIRTAVVEAFDAEILATADEGDDAMFLELRKIRAAVVADLTARGGDLADVETVTMPQSMPALFVAHRLYNDSRRADELIGRVDPPHPLFMPASFEALAF